MKYSAIRQNVPENLHGHIPTVQLVGEKQEYFQFDLLSSAQMLYLDHKPIIQRIWKKKNTETCKAWHG